MCFSILLSVFCEVKTILRQCNTASEKSGHWSEMLVMLIFINHNVYLSDTNLRECIDV